MFAQIIASPSESEEVKTRIGSCLKHLFIAYAQPMQQIISTLPAAEARIVTSFMMF